MKTITIENETWKLLNLMKYNLGLETIDDVVGELIGIYTKSLKKESDKNENNEHRTMGISRGTKHEKL